MPSIIHQATLSASRVIAGISCSLLLSLSMAGCTPADAPGDGANQVEREAGTAATTTPDQAAVDRVAPAESDEQASRPVTNSEEAQEQSTASPDPDHPFAHTGLPPRRDFYIVVADMDPDSTAFHIEFEMEGDTADAFHIDSDIFLLYEDIKLHLRGLSPVEKRTDDEGRARSYRFVYSGAVERPMRPRAETPVAILLDDQKLSRHTTWRAGPFERVR